MSIFEYNEELHIQMERKDAREEGYAEGKEDGILTMVRAILKANEPALHRIAKYLLEKETITGDEFMQILRQGD